MLCTRVPKLHVPAAELWKELVLDVHGTCHLDKHGWMYICACKCGVGSLVHRRKFDRSQSDAAVLCAAALVFPSLGQDLRNNQTNAGYPEGFGMVERSPFRFAVVNLSATRKYVQVALVQASLPTRTINYV